VTDESLRAAVLRAVIDNPLAFSTNTPPHLLADHMISAAQQFERTLLARADYFRRPTGVSAKQEP
jgi:hypothetical protein